MTRPEGTYLCFDFVLPVESGVFSVTALLLFLADTAKLTRFEQLDIEGLKKDGWRSTLRAGSVPDLAAAILAHTTIDFLSLSLSHCTADGEGRLLTDRSDSEALRISLVDGMYVSVLLADRGLEDSLGTALRKGFEFQSIRRTRDEFASIR